MPKKNKDTCVVIDALGHLFRPRSKPVRIPNKTTTTSTTTTTTTSTTTTSTTTTSTSTTSTTTTSMQNWIRVGAGEYQIFYIDNSGVLYGAGNNIALQGTNNGGDAGLPNACVQQFGAMPTFTKCYGGLHDGAAIDSSGYAWHMGQNDTNGLAGIGSTAVQPYSTKITVDASSNPFTGIVDMASFFLSSAGGWVAVKSDGTVWIWGNCTSGFRGDGTDGGIELRPVQVTLAGGKLATKVVAGYMIMVLCTDGTVQSWGGGCNPYGNSLGYSCTGNDYKSPHQVSNVTGAVGIAGGRNWNWAWSNTKVWACGYPKLNGTGSTSNDPIQVFTEITGSFSLALPLKAMVTNSNATIAIDANGALWGTGNSPQGEVGDGSTLDMSTQNYFWDLITDNLITTWHRIVSSRSDFVKVYGAMPYTYYFYAEASNGQWYFFGRDKGGIGGDGEVSGDYLAGGIDSSYPNSWDKPTAIPVNPFTLIGKILTPSPYCVANPSGSPCNNYTIPATHTPSANAGVDQSIGTTTTTLSGSGTPFAGRTICRYRWSQISGPNTALFDELCKANPSVSGLINGTYVFRLQVCDNVAETGTDDISVTKT